MNFPFLSVIIFIPLVAALILIFVKNENPNASRVIALVATLASFCLALTVFVKFLPTENIQFVESYDWIPGIGITYLLGVDGISLLLLLLTTFLGPIMILASWNSVSEHHRGFIIALLLAQTGVSGTLLALDLILFFVFLQATLLPLFFLIGIWGKKESISASNRFVLYNVAGSIFMIVAILILYFYHAGLTTMHTFNFLIISKIEVPPAYQGELFLLFAFGFAIMVPVFPFHAWFKDVCKTAPTAVNVLISAVFVKIGIYGFLRFCWPLFPEAALRFTPWLLGLAVVSLMFGALAAIVQRNLMKVLASITFSQLSLAVIGAFAINAQGIQGSLIQMISQGLSVGALFLLLGILYERKPFSEIESFGGLARKIPIWTVFFALVCFSLVGLPGMSGFVGEFLTLLGIYTRNKLVAVCVAIGIILVAVYMIRLFQKLAFGPALSESENINDLSFREVLVLAPIIVAIFLVGVYPNLLLKKIEPSVNHLTKIVENSGMGYSNHVKKVD